MASTTPNRPRRADAQRNVDAILDAALTRLSADPSASIADIAAAAGVGRMTLYGHFRTRADLVDALLARLLEHSNQVLDKVDVDGPPAAALSDLIASAWQLVHQFHSVLLAAQSEMPEERIRAHHDQPMHRVSLLIERGRAAGEFRQDISASWMVAVFYSVLHTAAAECAAGRLDADDAARTITATILAVFAAPAT
ncbi:TetR/AcrR family transcriptional regulator [Dactylosporangium sp. NPDC000521]|uniref:TetR/AcrR family transcriptional regulator n=1 Tax=Dactylosporangium sp. NPDC000521 TaxID=3363975 RepID=UPI0036AC84A8